MHRCTDAPGTGRVRASVSLPLYDPENVAASIARQDTSLVNRASVHIMWVRCSSRCWPRRR